MVLVFLGVMNYLIDAYTIFAASVLAANAVLRSMFGFAFPLFTSQMYDSLGLHWAGSVPAFLALACVPFPFLFYKYGPAIRERCKYAAESAAFLKQMQDQMQQVDSSVDEDITAPSEDTLDKEKEQEEEREEEEHAAVDYSYEPESEQPRLEPIRTRQSTRPSLARTRTNKSYDGNPFDLDRANTKESFRWEAPSGRGDGSRSRASSMTSKTSRR